MKCPECDGVGYKKLSLTSCAICERCGGMGEVTVTNDEWRKHCSAEEFAKFVEKAMDYGAFCQTKDDFSPDECKKCGCPWCKNGFMEWLKEVHDDK